MLMVAPTETLSRKMLVPFSRPPTASAMTKPPWVSTWAPRARKPFRCWSMGRVPPKSQPPGRATSARPNRPSSAPSM